jgi:hypothetical protein
MKFLLIEHQAQEAKAASRLIALLADPLRCKALQSRLRCLNRIKIADFTFLLHGYGYGMSGFAEPISIVAKQVWMQGRRRFIRWTGTSHDEDLREGN